MRRARTAAAIAAAAALPVVLAGAQAPPPAISVKLGSDGGLAYSTDPAGNRVIDFSSAGYGGGGVALPDVPARISDYDASRPMDEDHAWEAIAIDRIEDGWVRSASALHFAGSVINMLGGARAVTIEDVDAREPVSEPGGYRRRVFYTSS